ncbi:S-layer homology domain-containing protein [Paenibacillus andongensis]|uniref:S-layer homology domain-containing protein n=1 Tax=Paenibacillus andongensis TaxID=2975482 RepID=UPI0021BAEA2F|nr:S-layer homology domain-containing protein [Paenibacillus andongensis]
MGKYRYIWITCIFWLMLACHAFASTALSNGQLVSDGSTVHEVNLTVAVMDTSGNYIYRGADVAVFEGASKSGPFTAKSGKLTRVLTDSTSIAVALGSAADYEAGKWYKIGYRILYSPIGQGSDTIVIGEQANGKDGWKLAQDGAGYDLMFSVYKAPPSAPVISADPVAPTNGVVTVTINYPSDAVQKKYRIGSGSWQDYTGPISIVENGTVDAYAVDAAGNQSEQRSYTVSNIDKTPPVIIPYVTGITVSPKSVQLKLGSQENRQLQVTAAVSDNTTRDVTAALEGTTYASSDMNVATISLNGLIAAKQAGQSVITVTNGVYSDTVNLTISPADVIVNPPPPATPPYVTGITVSPKSVQLKLGSQENRQLQVTAAMSDNTTRDVTAALEGTTFASSDVNVATVSLNGLIAAKQAGQSVITVTNGVYSDTLNLTISPANVIVNPPPPATPPYVTGITVSPKSVQLKLGSQENRQLQVTAAMSDNTTRDVTAAFEGTTFASSDVNVATVSLNGLIAAKQAGQSVITVTNGVYQDNVKVTVSPVDVIVKTPPSDTSNGNIPSGAENPMIPSAATVMSAEREIRATEGGTVKLDNVVSIDIPDGALSKDGKITIVVIPTEHAPAFSGMSRLSPIVEFTSSENNAFQKPLKLSFSYESQNIEKGKVPAVFYYNENQARWIYVGGQAGQDGSIVMEINHFTKFGVFAVSLKVFSDLSGHWSQAYAQRLIGMGAIHGYEDGTFRPDQTVTRAEFVKLLADLLALKPAAGSTAFLDSTSIPDWAKDAVGSAVQAGWVQGDGVQGHAQFKPNEPVTRAEIAMIFSRILPSHSDSATPVQTVFSDQVSIPEWAHPAIQWIASQHLINGYPDGSFRAEEPATRAETVKMLSMLLSALHL